MKERVFPENFLWGSAISAYQTEGGNVYSDWYFWEEKGKTVQLSKSCSDSYHRLVQDIDYLTELNQNAFRLSVEWSRIEPKESVLIVHELDHYRTILQTLKTRKIKVFLTIHHFTNPQWFSELGGWTQKKNIDHYLRFVQLLVDEFKDYVDFWITFNEPMIYAQNAFREGIFPPGKRSHWMFRRVVKNMILAHRRAYKIIHTRATNPKVGIAKNNQHFIPYGPGILNRLVVYKTRLFWNHYFLRKIGRRQDFIGLNYYFQNKLKFSPFTDWSAPNHFFSRIMNDNVWVSDNGFQISPEGLYHVLCGLKVYRVPIYITENGIADAKDTMRKKFIFQHLRSVYIAIKDFCPVRGYLYWSLLDNYEWGSFKPRFGLIEVNYATQKRTVRHSARYYASICKKNAIEF
ncbi:MAG TPA: glycoside hydrolase family 1 protein [Patescibacteria group bacterium]|nr:glycoside hydrolase family 1 protein [Patescibacteria group bacterium]